jgi:FAD/FMN-containing dehydrogenase
VLELGGALEKNNTGLDLRQLFIGSEGTLGVITEATLKLTRLPGASTTLSCSRARRAAVLELFRAARRGPFTLMAYEFFTAACSARAPPPAAAPAARPRGPYYVLVEAEGGEASGGWRRPSTHGSRRSSSKRLASPTAPWRQSSARRRELWALREGISESLSATGLPHKNDVALPIAGSTPSAPSSTRLRAALPRLGDLPLRPHRRRQPAHQRDEARSPREGHFHAETQEADRALFELVRAPREHLGRARHRPAEEAVPVYSRAPASWP